MLPYMYAGVVQEHSSCRNGPLELVLELAVPGEEVGCKGLSQGVNETKALMDLVNLKRNNHLRCTAI
jgi:hypothetical protein